MHSNYAVLDRYLDIVSGTPEFFGFVGATAHSSIYSLLDSNYFHTVKDAHELVLADRVEKRLFIKLSNSHNVQKDCYIVLTPYEDIEEDYVYFEIYEMDSLIAECRTLTRHTAVLHSVALLKQIILFEYTLKQDELYIYICNDGSVFELFKGKLSAFGDRMLKNDRVAEDSVEDFHRLLNLVGSGAKNIDLYLKIDPFSTGEKLNYHVDANLISINNEPEAVGGTISTGAVNENDRLFSNYDKDPMTGVLNKNAIIRYTNDRLRMRTTQNVTLAILDLDNFKQVNDTLGHAEGDKIILQFADIIKGAIGTSGAVGRFGGDEFMTVVDDMKSVEELRQYFRAIRSNTERAFKNIAPGLSVTTSIGIVEATRVEGELTYDNMFKTCDTCLYIAKEFGKNRYVMYDDRTKGVIGKSENIGQLRKNRFQVNADFNLKITNALFERRLDAIPDVIKQMGESLSLNNINIYVGDKPRLIYHWGSEDTSLFNMDYVFEDDYIKCFNDDCVFNLMSSPSIQSKMPTAYDELRAQGIYSAMQYLMHYEDRVVGLISFELPQPGRYWHRNEMNSFLMICPLISQLVLSEYIVKNK